MPLQHKKNIPVTFAPMHSYSPVYNLQYLIIYGFELFRFGRGCLEPGVNPLDDPGLLPASQAEAAAQRAYRVRLCSCRLQPCTLQILSLVKSRLGGELRYSALYITRYQG